MPYLSPTTIDERGNENMNSCISNDEKNGDGDLFFFFEKNGDGDLFSDE